MTEEKLPEKQPEKQPEKKPKSNKKILAILAVVVVIVVIIGAALFLGGYPNCLGDVSAESGNVTLEYNNDASGSYYIEYSDGSTGTAYYDEKVLMGTVKIDLSEIDWDESFEPEEGKNDYQYAEENAAKDIAEYLDSNEEGYSQSVSIDYYDSSGSSIYVSNEGTGYFDYNMSISGDTLTIEIYEDYQEGSETTITNDDNYGGVLSETQSDVDEIDSAKLTVDFHLQDKFWYTFDVDLDDVFKLKHM